jgi:hypothetical protein
VRLSTLSPEAVGRDAAERVLTRLSRLAVPLSPGVTLALSHADAAASGLALTVADLTRFAQSGDTADWGSHHGAEDALLEVGEALWSRPIDDGSADGWTVDDLRAALAADDDPRDPVRLAVGCAVARWLIADGQPVTTGELAALASVSTGRVQQLAADGELETTVERRGRASVALVAAAEARRWLAARGVAGWQ